MKKRQNYNKKFMVCVFALLLIAILPVYSLALNSEVNSNVEVSKENMWKFTKRTVPEIIESSTEEKEEEFKFKVLEEVELVDTCEVPKEISAQVENESKEVENKETMPEEVVVEAKTDTTTLEEQVMPVVENIQEESKIFIGNDGVSYKSVKTMEFRATAYCHCKKCCGKEPGHQAYGITASGLNLIDLLEQGIKPRIVAADTRVLPFGTKIYVEVPEAERSIYVQEDYGFASVEDIGSAIKNMKIDVYFPTDVEACEWGIKNVIVHVLEPAE